MKTVLAAIDNSLAVKPVLSAARALAELVDARVEAVHVSTNGDRTARDAAQVAEVPYRTVSGHVVDEVVAAGAAVDVVALAIGSRGTPGHRRPVGKTAAAVATTLAKPVLVVPPDADPPQVFKRVLVPVEAGLSAFLAPRAVLEVASGATIEAVALHVYDEDSLPRFTDQPQHEQAAWAREFLARYCPSGVSDVRLETRVGRSEELVPLAAHECGCDLVALGWAQELARERAPVVVGTLERSHVPVFLIPVRLLRPDLVEVGTPTSAAVV